MYFNFYAANMLHLILCGIFFHFIFFFSVFDIYFHTSIIHNINPTLFEYDPPAHRIVLIIADGLRADSLFSPVNGSSASPFIRHIIENIGTWGISHTRVPSESRPGHVAIIGGIYEDPSAITLGWKENPVHFDSVFNRSTHTWSWGSPDILPMFSKGATDGIIDTFTYSSQLEDFGGKDASILDTWVFDQVSKFLKNAIENKTENERLMRKGNVFFLHLLGIDTNGHTNKPHSEEYLRNIKIVDSGVEKIFKLFENFFKDEKTAYIFTSDHGMTDWGSHGAGDPSETETPIVAWGSGIAGPEDPSNFVDRMLYDSRVAEWGLNHVRRHDVRQADLAPLMSAIIAVPIPVNSVGTLPEQYLLKDDEIRARAIFTNALQMREHYRERHKKRERDTASSLFKPYPYLTLDVEAESILAIQNHIQNGSYEYAIAESHSLIRLCMEGLDYYIHYDTNFLTAVILVGFFSWIVTLICFIIKNHTSINSLQCSNLRTNFRTSNNRVSVVLFFLIAFSTVVFLLAKNSPWTHYIYCSSTFVSSVFCVLEIKQLKSAWRVAVDANAVWEVAIRFLVMFIGVEVLVVSFFVRALLSMGLAFVAVWPFVLNVVRGQAEKSLRLSWIGAAILLASFTYMPVVGKHANYTIVQMSGLLALAFLIIGFFWCGSWNSSGNACYSFYVSAVMILASVYVVHDSSFHLSLKQGLPAFNQIFAWIILALSFTLPLLSSEYVIGRLVCVTSSLICPFILLSIRHEVLFYIALSVAMFLWIVVELHLSENVVQIYSLTRHKWSNLRSNEKRNLEWADLRRAYFFLLFIILSFFGTGNIASVNSFDPNFVFCFLTVFSPFIMGSLLLLKIIIPFLLVTCFFNAVCSLLKVPVESLFLIFLLLSDVMAVQFFLLVKTEGSWLDIGTSLSHFIISMATTVFIMILMQVANLMTTKKIRFCHDAADKNCERDEFDVLPRIVKSHHRD